MLERSVTGLGHYRNSQNWSEADEEHINECNALLDRFNSSAEELAAAPQAAVHPDDAAVDALAALMKTKLEKQRDKGYGGWSDKTQCSQQRLSDMLRAHVDKGDPVDVANFCAFLVARGEGIAAAPQDAAALLGKYRKLCIEIGRGDSYHLKRIEAAIAALASTQPASQAVQLTLNGYQLLAALRLANPSLNFAPMELLTDIVLSDAPLVDFDGAQLHEGPIAWVDGVNESAIALEAEHETDLCAETHPTQQGLEPTEQRQLDIGKAIERACIDLPQGTELIVLLEKDAGTVALFDSNGNEFDHFNKDYETFAERINMAIDGAIAAKQVAAQAKQEGV